MVDLSAPLKQKLLPSPLVHHEHSREVEAFSTRQLAQVPCAHVTCARAGVKLKWPTTTTTTAVTSAVARESDVPMPRPTAPRRMLGMIKDPGSGVRVRQGITRMNIFLGPKQPRGVSLVLSSTL